VCVCVCVFACLLACLLACCCGQLQRKWNFFFWVQILITSQVTYLSVTITMQHKALDQIFLSIWRAPYIHEYFVKRFHEEVTQFVKWIVWCVYSLSKQGILHLLIGIRSYHYEGLGESTLPTPHLPLVLLHLEGTLYSWNSSLILTLK